MPAVVTESPLSNVHHIRATLRLTAAGCQLDTATLSDCLLTRFLCEWRSYFLMPSAVTLCVVVNVQCGRL